MYYLFWVLFLLLFTLIIPHSLLSPVLTVTALCLGQLSLILRESNTCNHSRVLCWAGQQQRQSGRPGGWGEQNQPPAAERCLLRHCQEASACTCHTGADTRYQGEGDRYPRLSPLLAILWILSLQTYQVPGVTLEHSQNFSMKIHGFFRSFLWF